MELNNWHKLAYLYIHKDLQLSEIVRAWYILGVAGFNGDDVPLMGYGVLDNQNLYQALVLAMIVGYPAGETVSQTEIAKASKWSRATVTRTVTAMKENGILAHDGSKYTVLDDSKVPQWIYKFGKALIELHLNPELIEPLEEHYNGFQFRRGFQVLWDELRAVRERKTYNNES